MRAWFHSLIKSICTVLYLNIFLFRLTLPFSCDEHCLYFISKWIAQLIRQSNFTEASQFDKSILGSNMDVKTRSVTSTAIWEIQLKPNLLKSTFHTGTYTGSDGHAIK